MLYTQINTAEFRVITPPNSSPTKNKKSLKFKEWVVGGDGVVGGALRVCVCVGGWRWLTFLENIKIQKSMFLFNALNSRFFEKKINPSSPHPPTSLPLHPSALLPISKNLPLSP